MGRATKVLIVTNGSRGDCQPFIAIARALQHAGYTVLLASNVNNKQLAKELGCPFCPVFADCEAAILETPGLSESMCNGDTFSFLIGVQEYMAHDAPAVCEKFIRILREFKPDLLLHGTHCHYLGMLAALEFNIPAISVKLQCLVYDPKRMMLGLPTLPCGCHRFLLNSVYACAYEGFKPFDEAMAKQFGYKILDVWTKRDFIQDLNAPWAPEYICQSPSWKEALNPCADAKYKFVGACIIQAESQSGQSFGGSETVRAIRSFLAAGQKPIYCGWGSMTCKSQEHMVLLAAWAIRHSKQRAIILIGSAKLSMTALTSATDDEALLGYAEKNILFLDSAPHEWLFPQVLCTIHHGGTGTLAASMRAGVPTVVTPVFFDQWDHAYLVNKLGVGIGFDKQFQIISATELGDAIKRVVESPDMAANAKQMGETMRGEDGSQNIVDAVQDFWHEWVESRKYQAKIREMKRVRTEAQQMFLSHIVFCLCRCLSFFSTHEQQSSKGCPQEKNRDSPMPSLLKSATAPVGDMKRVKLAAAQKFTFRPL